MIRTEAELTLLLFISVGALTRVVPSERNRFLVFICFSLFSRYQFKRNENFLTLQFLIFVHSLFFTSF